MESDARSANHIALENETTPGPVNAVCSQLCCPCEITPLRAESTPSKVMSATEVQFALPPVCQVLPGKSTADLEKQTEGVICRKDKGVLDEIPGAYKNIDEVMANQSDLVEVVHTLKQVLCVKG